MEHRSISLPLINDIANYLSGCPYREVAHLLARLQEEIAGQPRAIVGPPADPHEKPKQEA